jgi:hypothetical protein
VTWAGWALWQRDRLSSSVLYYVVILAYYSGQVPSGRHDTITESNN